MICACKCRFNYDLFSFSWTALNGAYKKKIEKLKKEWGTKPIPSHLDYWDDDLEYVIGRESTNHHFRSKCSLSYLSSTNTPATLKTIWNAHNILFLRSFFVQKYNHVVGVRISTLIPGSFLRLSAASKNTSTVSLSKFVNRTRSTELAGWARKNCSTVENRILAHRRLGNPNMPLLMADTAILASFRLWHSDRELNIASWSLLSSSFWPPSHTGPIKTKNQKCLSISVHTSQPLLLKETLHFPTFISFNESFLGNTWAQ